MQALPVFVFCLFLFISNTLPAQLNITAYPPEEGVAGSCIYAITQDQKGFIWIATDNGISRFDGFDFVNYKISDGLPSNEILHLFPDSKGRLWIFPYNNTPCYLKDDSIHEVKLKYSGNLNLFFATEDEKNNVWIGGSKIIKVSPSGSIHMHNLSSSDYLFKNDQLYFIERNYGKLTSLSKDTLIQKPFLEDYTRAYTWVEQIAEDDIIACNSKLTRIKEGQQYTLMDAGKLREFGQVYQMMLDQKDNLWLSTKKGLLCIRHISEQYNTTQNYDHYLKGTEVLNCFRDREGNYWAGTRRKGVLFFNDNSNVIRQYQKKHGLSGTNVTNICFDPDSNIWIGYSNGRLDYLDISKDTVTPVPLPLNTQRGEIQEIFTDHKGNTWVVVEGNSIFILNRRKILKRTFFGAVKEIDQFGEQLCVAVHGGIHFISSLNSIPEFDSKTSKDIILNKLWDNEKGIRFLSPQAIEKKSDSQLWVGHANGLSIYENDSVFPFPDAPPSLQHHITTLESHKELLWAGTKGGGIIRIDKDTAFQLTIADGLPSNDILSLCDISNENVLWASTPAGIAKITYTLNNHGTAIKKVDKLNTIQGLLANHVNEIIVRKGQVYVATTKGLSIIKTNQFQSDTTKPLVQVNNIEINHRDTVLRKAYFLPHSSNAIRISFKGIDFTSKGNVSYSYRMSGIDSNWVPTENHSILFAGLSPGKYQFHLKAFDQHGNTGVLSSPLTFVIASPWWQSWWFRIALLISVIGSIYAFFRFNLFHYNQDIFRDLLLKVRDRFIKKHHIFIKVQSEWVKVDCAAIYYLKAAGNYVEIKTGKEKYLTRSTLKKVQKELPVQHHFMRVHRSYIIRTEAIDELKKDEVVIAGHSIPIGRSYQQKVNQLKQGISGINQ